MAESNWFVLDRFVNLSTNWFTLIGEHIQTGTQTLEYWRVEKVDSVVVLPIQDQQLLLPPATYRPGVQQATIDFPGGRCPKDQEASTVAVQILQRELGIEADMIQSLQPLNNEGWSVNSSFSNQKLYGFVAELNSGPIPSLGSAYPISDDGINELLEKLVCLQCRMVLREWQQQFAESVPKQRLKS